MVVALTGSAAGVAEVEESWVALVTFGPVNSSLADTDPQAVAKGIDSTIGVTGAGQAAAGAIGKVSLFTVLTLQAAVARHT